MSNEKKRLEEQKGFLIHQKKVYNRIGADLGWQQQAVYAYITKIEAEIIEVNRELGKL